MTSSIRASLRPGLVLLAACTALLGIAYPLTVTAVAQVAFPLQANGSLIVEDGRVVGSELIGQPFDGPRYFWSRPSATTPHGYNGGASSGSNQGPGNPDLVAAVADRVAAVRAAHPMERGPVPVDLVTASGSGLDPHISVVAARYQIARVARERGLAEAAVARLVDEHGEGRLLGLFGEPRVNVLRLNLALDRAAPDGQ